MCPRVAFAKVRPGDQVWPMLQDTTPIMNDDEETIDEVPHHTPCLCLGLDNETATILVLPPSMRFGWSYRVFWERAGEDKKEYDLDDAPPMSKCLTRGLTDETR